MADSVRDSRNIGTHFVDKCKVCDGTMQLKLCAKCRSISYCSKEHQKLDWPNHKKQCKKITAQNSDSRNQNVNKPSCSKDTVTQMTNVTMGIECLSIDAAEGLNPVTSTSGRVFDGESSCVHASESTSAGLFTNTDISKRDGSAVGNVDKYSHSEAQNHSSNSLQTENTCEVDEQNSFESGSSEKFILESEETALVLPEYSTANSSEADSEARAKMPYFSVLESRNKALSDYVTKCLNSYGVCVIDNFLGENKGTDILDEVKDLHENGELISGQLINTTSPKGVVRGDVITWVDGSEMGCNSINSLITSIDAIMVHCQRTLGHYNIKGRSKVGDMFIESFCTVLLIVFTFMLRLLN